MLRLPNASRPLAGWKIRAKLMVLHNLLFLVLAGGLYLTVGAGAARELFLALAVVYIASVLALELFVMPQFIYRPLAEVAAELERMDHTVDELRRALAGADRLATLGLMSAQLAHEINSPLSVLHGSIESLLEQIQDGSYREKLRRMLRVTERLRRISGGVLAFSRPSGGDVRPVAVRSVVDEAWSLVSFEPKASAVTFLNETRDHDFVAADPSALVQVFVNLLRNALDAVSSGGVIVVRSSRLAAGGQDWVQILIEDDGPGVPADLLPRLFEAFATNRPDRRGVGLGLNVSHEIVQRHGGTIAAGNRPGGGASFEVRLQPASMEVTA